MRQHQLDAFIHSWENKGDLLMCLSTGCGKSLVYQLAASLLKLRDKRNYGSIIVISPLIIILLDQINTIRHRGVKLDRGVKCCKRDVEGRTLVVNNGALIRENKFKMFMMTAMKLTIAMNR